MELTVTDAAKQRLAKYLQGDVKIVLDYDDGVGPFSDLGNCSLDANYKLVFVKPDADLPDFDAHFSSNIGEIYYKGYTAPQYDPQMRLEFESTFFTMPLKSSQGTLTDNIEVVDLTAHDFVHQAVQTHDC